MLDESQEGLGLEDASGIVGIIGADGKEASMRAPGREGRPKRRGVKGRWDSDSLIVNRSRLKRLLAEVFVLPRPKVTHSEGWLSVNPGNLLGGAGCGNAARPDL